jgi:anthranilate/para-aminobenzoate synthase component II
MRYHSLIADPNTFPHDELRVIARTTEEEEIFAVRHKKYPIYGVQFHPESVGTEDGKSIIKNFLEVCNDQRSD